MSDACGSFSYVTEGVCTVVLLNYDNHYNDSDSADADDDFGFTTTIQNFNDGKKYSTTTDSDE